MLPLALWSQGEVQVEVRGATPGGNVIVMLFDRSEDFPRRPLMQRVIPVKGRQAVHTTFAGLKPGTYAVAVVEDANGNGRLDFYFFGPPKERVLASRYAKGRFGPPPFEEAAFRVDHAPVKVVLDFDR